MASCKTGDDLLEEEASCVFLELASSAHVGEQVAATTYLHDEHYVLLRLKRLIQSHDIVITGSPQNVKLLHDLALRLLL